MLIQYIYSGISYITMENVSGNVTNLLNSHSVCLNVFSSFLDLKKKIIKTCKRFSINKVQ